MHVHSTSSEGATITHDVKIGSDDYLDGINVGSGVGTWYGGDMGHAWYVGNDDGRDM